MLGWLHRLVKAGSHWSSSAAEVSRPLQLGRLGPSLKLRETVIYRDPWQTILQPGDFGSGKCLRMIQRSNRNLNRICVH